MEAFGNKLELKHNSEKFSLKINNQEIECVEEYKLEFRIENKPLLDLTLKISINENISNIDIDI